VKGKVLIKCHAMRHIREWRYSFTILNLGTSCRWVVGFLPQMLYPRGKTPSTHLISWVSSRPGLDTGLEKNILPLPGIEARLSDYSPSLYRLSCPIMHVLELEFFLLPTVSRPVSLGIGPPFGTLDQILACSPSFCLTITLFCFQCVLSDERTGL
jgi:hypothetical protein